MSKTIDLYQIIDVPVVGDDVPTPLPTGIKTDRDATRLIGIQAVPIGNATVDDVSRAVIRNGFRVGNETILDDGFPLRLMTSNNSVAPQNRFFLFNDCKGIPVCEDEIQASLFNTSVDFPAAPLRLILWLQKEAGDCQSKPICLK